MLLPMQELVDLHVFAGAQKVVADLRQHDCTAALMWCEEHRGRLKKGKNKLEFRLRMQVSLLTTQRAATACMHVNFVKYNSTKVGTD